MHHIIFQVFTLKLIIFKLSFCTLIANCCFACLFCILFAKTQVTTTTTTTNDHEEVLKYILKPTILQLVKCTRQTEAAEVLIKMFYCNSLENLWNEIFWAEVQNYFMKLFTVLFSYFKIIFISFRKRFHNNSKSGLTEPKKRKCFMLS